jgi:hypothetical protein
MHGWEGQSRSLSQQVLLERGLINCESVGEKAMDGHKDINSKVDQGRGTCSTSTNRTATWSNCIADAKVPHQASWGRMSVAVHMLKEFCRCHPMPRKRGCKKFKQCERLQLP